MTLGSVARVVLGKRIFPRVGNLYRSFFVDLKKVAESIEKLIPQNASVLDIGGGDGAIIDALLRVRPDIRVTLIDLKESLGGTIHQSFLNRVTIFPSTSILNYAEKKLPAPDCILISDVLHHIPIAARIGFFSDLKKLISGRPLKIIVKDVEPGSFHSRLFFLADYYISGDKSVSLISQTEVKDFISEFTGQINSVEETDLLKINFPNYAISFGIGLNNLHR